jgi:BlaI family transcriptional regulator, penicillinase repressor
VVARLGDLERAVMEVLWDLPASPPDSSSPATATARQIADRLVARRPLAYTTVLTVLHRLERKRLVRRLREGRAHRYAPVASREAYVTQLMVEALGGVSDPGAVLVRFVEAVSSEEAEVLRQALQAGTTPGTPAAAPSDTDPPGQERRP